MFDFIGKPACSVASATVPQRVPLIEQVLERQGTVGRALLVMAVGFRIPWGGLASDRIEMVQELVGSFEFLSICDMDAFKVIAEVEGRCWGHLSRLENLGELTVSPCQSEIFTRAASVELKDRIEFMRKLSIVDGVGSSERLTDGLAAELRNLWGSA